MKKPFIMRCCVCTKDMGNDDFACKNQFNPLVHEAYCCQCLQDKDYAALPLTEVYKNDALT